MYASEDGRVASLSSQECIFFVKYSGAAHVMTLQVLQALDQCREFRTLHDHAARIESTVPGLAGKGEDIRRVLDGLVQRKLLVRDADFIARFHNAVEREPPPLRAVFIRACDRPARLACLLDSLVDYEQHFGANRRYVLIDDSINARHIDEQRELLREFARATACKVSYVGRSASAKLVEKFARAKPHVRDAIRALLLRQSHPQAQRFGGGRSRNLALLLSAGARLILLDDDLRLPLRRPDFARTGLTLVRAVQEGDMSVMPTLSSDLDRYRKAVGHDPRVAAVLDSMGGSLEEYTAQQRGADGGTLFDALERTADVFGPDDPLHGVVAQTRRLVETVGGIDGGEQETAASARAGTRNTWPS